MSKAGHISTVEADLMFAKILSKKQKAQGTIKASAVAGRMEFDEFIVALKQISAKIYPDLDNDEALLKLVEDKILPLEK
jgi:GGDEF domain-containing protein